MKIQESSFGLDVEGVLENHLLRKMSENLFPWKISEVNGSQGIIDSKNLPVLTCPENNAQKYLDLVKRLMPTFEPTPEVALQNAA